MPKVLISDKMSPLAEQTFKARGVDVDYKPGLDKDELLKIIGDYDGLAIRSSTKVTPKVLEASDVLTYHVSSPEAVRSMLEIPRLLASKGIGCIFFAIKHFCLSLKIHHAWRPRAFFDNGALGRHWVLHVYSIRERNLFCSCHRSGETLSL